MKHVIILGVIALALALFTACSGGGGERYPQYVRNNFITGCVAAFSGDPGVSNYCHCGLRELEAHVTLEDYIVLEEDMAHDPNYMPPQLQDAILKCLDELPATWQPTPEY